MKIKGVFIGIMSLILLNCSTKKDHSNGQTSFFDTLKSVASENKSLSGKQLSQAICGSCHIFPEPGLLDKKTWKNGVLPHMALRLGFISFDNNPYAKLSSQEKEAVIKANVFPHQPVIDSAAWDKIVQYYESEAPSKALAQDEKPVVQLILTEFTINPVSIPHTQYPLVTLLEYDDQNNHWYVGDRQSNLYRLNQQFQLLDSIKLDSPPASIGFSSDRQLLVLTMGEMDPNDKNLGTIVSFDTSFKQTSTIVQKLTRPVHFLITDINADGIEDKIVCEFGNYTGRLTWFEGSKDKQYKEHILKQTPGTRKTVVSDINQDGLPDIVCLMSQGNEGIFAFINLDKGKFSELPLLRFPPVYGSSDFELVDFNQDGYMDILYTNGDNADFSYSLKKYHGVRIFINNGKNKFEEKWFYPMHGATKAMAADFDQDGDLDVSAIAFFPNFTNAYEEGFIYFENTGNFTF